MSARILYGGLESDTDHVCLLRRKVRYRENQQKEEDRQQSEALCSACDNSVIPREYCELVQAGQEVPACSRVARDKDPECEYGECVHLQRHAKRVVGASVGEYSAARVRCSIA
jgi:hypothetical protein